MRILLIEPYYTGSHKVWADGYKKHSNHEVELLTLEGRHWKWRMHGAAIEIAQVVNDKYLNKDYPDLLFISDMLDLTCLKSLLHPDIASIPTAFYFHENQLSYPYTDQDTDTKRVRDFHYGFINYTSALAANKVFFNSKAQMDSFFEALEDLLKRMPDYKGLNNIQQLKDKTSVLPLGIDYKTNVCGQSLDEVRRQVDEKHPTILWTHRWEYDKNPDDFFGALERVSKDGYDFNLAVLGAKSPKPPKVFSRIKEDLKKHIVAYGKPDTFDSYLAWLEIADLLPITSVHETFGISLMEALYHGVQPLLPKRLSYPELVDPEVYANYYYHDQEDLVAKIKAFIETYNNEKSTVNHYESDSKTQACKNDAKRNKLTHLAQSYDWQSIVKVYDQTLEDLICVEK